MIVSGVHLGDKKAAHVLLSYQPQQPQYNPPPSAPRPSSTAANAGLKSSLGSADSGDWVLNTIPTPPLRLPRLEYDLASTHGTTGGGRFKGGQRWVRIVLGPH